MEPLGQERRAEPRIPYVTEAFVERTHGGGDRISDLSGGGAFLETMTPHPVGAQFTLMFRLPDGEIRVSAETRHVMPHIGAGVRFLDLTAEHRAALDRFVKTLVP
jgi:hypothetical protein